MSDVNESDENKSKLNPNPEYKVEQQEGAKLNDESFGDMLNVIAHCTFETFDGLVPYKEKTDEEREELLRVAMKSIEVASVIACKFFDSETFEAGTAKEISDALKSEDFEKANALLATM